MKTTLSVMQFRDRLLADARGECDRLRLSETGALAAKGVYVNCYSMEQACQKAYGLAVAYHLSGEEEFRRVCHLFLDYAGRGLLRVDGLVYWPAPVPSLCAMGRWARCAFYAAKLTDCTKTMAWLEEMFSSWPYNEAEHRFVERFVAGIHAPTSVNGFLSTYNMIAEGVADAWLVAEETGNTQLKNKARDTLVNFILPGQRSDGFWNYSAPKPVDMGLLNDGEQEYNYCLYLLNILSNLLPLPEAGELLLEPIRKGMSTLLSRFGHDDGSIYAPVHWGWDHIWESTLLTALVSWRLFHHGGLSKFESVAAGALGWLSLAEMGGKESTGGALSNVGLFSNPLFWDLCGDDFLVSGEVCDRQDVAATLERVERELAHPPADDVHLSSYFSLRVYATHHALQRKIHRLKKEEKEVLSVTRFPQQSTVALPWQFPATCTGGRMAVSWDDENFTLTVDCDRRMDDQPYTGAGLFRGDGLFLEWRTPGGRVLLSLTEE